MLFQIFPGRLADELRKDLDEITLRTEPQTVAHVDDGAVGMRQKVLGLLDALPLHIGGEALPRHRDEEAGKILRIQPHRLCGVLKGDAPVQMGTDVLDALPDVGRGDLLFLQVLEGRESAVHSRSGEKDRNQIMLLVFLPGLL